MRILVVEDSESLRNSLRRALEHEFHTIDTEANGEDGLAALEVHDYDLLVLDIMLPKLDGLSLLRTIRSRGLVLPVLLLTARDTVEDRVRGFSEGADDYLVKPFALAELIARVAAIGRRPRILREDRIDLGPVQLNFTARSASLAGVALELTAREWKLLECLCQRRGQVVPRAEIEECIYDDKVEPMSNVVDTAVYGLRRKIGRELIRTRRGMGYMIAAEAGAR